MTPAAVSVGVGGLEKTLGPTLWLADQEPGGRALCAGCEGWSPWCGMGSEEAVLVLPAV